MTSVPPKPDSTFKTSDYSVTMSTAAQLQVMLAEMSQKKRQSQQDGWDRNLKLASAEKDNFYKQADEMRSSAAARLAGAVVNGVISTAAGGYQAWGSAKAVNAFNAANKQAQQSNAQPSGQAGPGSIDDVQNNIAQQAAGQGGAAQQRQASSQNEGGAAGPAGAAERQAEGVAGDLAHRAAGTPGAGQPSGGAQGSQAAPELGSQTAANASSQASPAARGASSELNDANNANILAQLELQKTQAFGQIGQVLGGMAKATGDFVGSQYDAQKTELEGDLKIIQATKENSSQATSLAGENASKLIDIAGQINQQVASNVPRFA